MTDQAANISTPAVLSVEQSVSGRRWENREGDDRMARAISQQYDLPDVVGRLLVARGVDVNDVDSYLNPTLKDLLPNPSILQDMDLAAGHLSAAIQNGEKIAVFGDYDVDGATSSALLTRFLSAVSVPPRIYIPDRLKEGYGPTAGAMTLLADEGVKVVITVDCGISSFDPLAVAKNAGLEVIVVDHHVAEATLPEAVAVINPNRLDEDGSLGHLAAVGVSFLLVIAVNRALREAGWYQSRPEPKLMQWLDLVALGTVCDVVPLKGLNRALVIQGLKVMAGRTNTGLSALSDSAKIDRRPEVYHAGFVLGPRINAGGRVGRADLGSVLLSSNDPVQAEAISAELEVFNAERRTIEAIVQEEAIAGIDINGEPPQGIVIAIGKNWHPGVIGIVASRLKDRYQRPALVIAIDDKGEGKGSGRSVKGVDLGAAVIAARQAGLLVNGGGHAMAAGITITEAKCAELVGFLEERLTPQVAALGVVRGLGIDGVLNVKGANTDLVDLLQQVGPFGAGNSEPRFAIADARVIKASIVGQGHVSCIFTGRDGGRLKGIAFRIAETQLGQALLAAQGKEIHVAGHLKTDSWQGRTDVQIFIDDISLK
ncbi:MAG: single-stranded-DNA-specific exonuclease RecJ [Alphaproteobacteria bacterium]|jgi:single-stranded-DNA-specific exonuclease|nr:single-stranded-DNA-specific exonuclease RecJ [Alphaproteobacteria bacterium]MBT4084148.1 single-stranded-DNA-specific exonuclease RecJ [Alphaproteobacteria bacterium]MBT4546517.1 single-stranded-DNA-specific exonuclease RecJ [Alphaproteobacteria bacterium]MBT7747741.1 single-stranded-DNA-specific exonuclease RecJ [Alphaproteobacteria bacterium]